MRPSASRLWRSAAASVARRGADDPRRTVTRERAGKARNREPEGAPRRRGRMWIPPPGLAALPSVSIYSPASFAARLGAVLRLSMKIAPGRIDDDPRPQRGPPNQHREQHVAPVGQGDGDPPLQRPEAQRRLDDR